MKKILISVILLLVLVLTGVVIINGLQIGKLNILGIREIQDENEKLDNKIQEATKLASTDYPKKIEELDGATKEFKNKKTEYEDMVSVSTESEVQASNQYGVYDISMLWVELGNHAKSEGITLDVSVKNLQEDTEYTNKIIAEKGKIEQEEKRYYCDLYFTVKGTYAGIAGVIEDIEDDSKLGFRIDDFEMTATSEGNNILQSTFTCKDIIIKGISSSPITSSSSVTTETNTTNTTTTTENNTVK